MSKYLQALFTLLRIIFLKCIYRSRIVFKNICLISRSAKIQIRSEQSVISFGSKVDIKDNCLIDAIGGKISFADNVFINRNGIIVSMESIEIGENTSIGPNVVIYDHDHDYLHDKRKYIFSKVKIGKNVWIGANCTILKGVTIGDNAIIAAGSIVNQNIPDNSLFYNKLENKIKEIG